VVVEPLPELLPVVPVPPNVLPVEAGVEEVPVVGALPLVITRSAAGLYRNSQSLKWSFFL